ncbi:DUF4286 family protein [Sphingobacterium sp. HJSM2_6]|uniref:DUF4286 family protein n=1 Tax=Sphingobacterium sp. HJSM2_6 TaxID=3366264 RepID=UPI003BD2B5F9
MFLYNLSIIIEESAHLDMLIYIKELIHKHAEKELSLLKMLQSPHDGFTYCLQVILKDDEEIRTFQSVLMSEMQTFISENHPQKAFLFDSIMQYIPHN